MCVSMSWIRETSVLFLFLQQVLPNQRCNNQDVVKSLSCHGSNETKSLNENDVADKDFNSKNSLVVSSVEDA